MTKLALHDLWSRKQRLVGMFSAILIGVAFLAGTLVLGDTMRSGFGTLFAEANAGTDALVRSSTRLESEAVEQQGRVPESVVEQVAATPGVAAAVPTVQGLGQIVGADGEPIGGNGPPTLAANWVGDDTLNPWVLEQGRAPARDGEVVVDRRSADEGDLAVGDTITVRTPEPVSADLVGIVTFGEEDSLSGATYVAFTSDEAARLLGGGQGFTGVLVRAGDGVDGRALAERLDRTLPDGFDALSSATLTTEQQQDIEDDFLGLFETFLLVFAGIALLVAMFSINNAFSILVAQRSRESALLRAIGASRAQVLRAVVVEALVVGTLAAVAGLVAGIGLAVGLRALMDAAGFTLPTGALAVDAPDMVIAGLVGLTVTVAASSFPALRSSRIPPIAAMREVAVDRVRGSGRRLAVGGGLAVVGAGAVVGGALGETLAVAGLGAVVLLVAMVLLGPVVAGPAASTLGWPLAKARGLVGSLAVRNAERNPRRTAGTASALMVGVAVVTLFTVFAASLKASVDDAASRGFRGDLVIADDSFSGSGLAPSLTSAIDAVPEVQVASALGNGVARFAGGTRDLTVVEPRGLESVLDLDVTAGALGALGRDALGVSQGFADDHGLVAGSRVPVTFGDGAREPLVVRVVYDDASLVGDVLLAQETWVQHATQPSNVAVLIALDDGVTIEAGRRAVQGVADQFAAPDVQTREEYVESVAGNVDQLLGVVYVLLALAILIALMGIANTLALSIHERTRELGLLRAVGETRGQLRAMIRGESAVIATFGTAGGLLLGVVVAWAVVRAVQSGGTLTAFAVPGVQLAIVLVVGAAAGLLAGLRPAGGRRASPCSTRSLA